MAVSVVADKNLKIAESAEEALVLQKYNISSIDAGTIERIITVLSQLEIKGVDLVVNLRPEVQPAQQSHTAQTQSNKTLINKAPFSDLDEDQRWELLKNTIKAGKQLSIFGEVVTVNPDLKVWQWNNQTFKSISSLANQIASATGRRGQWNGWAVLRITE